MESVLFHLSGKVQHTEASCTDLASLSEERPQFLGYLVPPTFAVSRFGDMRHKSTHFIHFVTDIAGPSRDNVVV